VIFVCDWVLFPAGGGATDGARCVGLGMLSLMGGSANSRTRAIRANLRMEAPIVYYIHTITYTHKNSNEKVTYTNQHTNTLSIAFACIMAAYKHNKDT